MSLQAEITHGAKVERYRGYVTGKALRRPSVEDHVNRAQAGGEPYKKGTKLRYDAEHVEFEGAVQGTSLTFDAGQSTVSKVVFFQGSVEEEVVVGSIDVGASGSIVIELTEAKDPSEETIVDV